MERQGGTKVHMAKTAQHLLSLASPSSRFKQILPVFFSGQRKTFRNNGFIAANKQNYQIACQKGRSWQPLGEHKNALSNFRRPHFFADKRQKRRLWLPNVDIFWQMWFCCSKHITITNLNASKSIILAKSILLC